MSKDFNLDQLKVIKAQGNVLVNASAGSGKTSVMIERVLRLLEDGADIKRMVIMTFTVAAASDMKAKLVKGIYQRLRAGNAVSARLVKQLDGIPLSNICTIDSFCYGIFQKHFAIVGRDPSCVIMEPDEAASVLNEVLEETCKEYIEKDDREFLLMSRRLAQGRQLDGIKEVLLSVKSFINAQAVDDEEFIERFSVNNLPAFTTEYFKKYFHRQMAAIISGARNYRGMTDVEETVNIDRLISELESAVNNAELSDALAQALAATSVKAVYKGKSEEQKEAAKAFYSALKDTNAQFSQYPALLKETPSLSGVGKIVEAALRVRQKYTDYKTAKNAVDFGDLKYYALKILNNNKAREQIRESIDYVFVDEYQDTDYVQEKIIDAVVMPDRLFTVGDNKQSIYRFRYAEPEIFNNRMKTYLSAKTGSSIPLSKNYRSDKRILDFVNGICRETITEEFCGIDYAADGMLTAEKNFHKTNDLPSALICTYSADKDKRPRQGVYSVKEDAESETENKEGAFIARTILSMAGKMKISDGDGGERLLGFSDIAVLAPRKSAFKRILPQLSANGIPFFTEESEESDPACAALVDFLRILTNAAQDIPLANVLSCGLFDFSQEELLRIRKENAKDSFSNAFFTYDGDKVLKEKIEHFSSGLAEYRFKASYMRASELLVEVMSSASGGYIMEKGLLAAERINAFVHAAAISGADSCAEDFIYYYDNVFKGIRLHSVSGAVTVTTVHKSKGLEYPVVFLAGADLKAVGGGGMNQAKLFYDKTWGVCMKTFDDINYSSADNFYTKVFKLKALQEERAELSRLLYVAMTRASNHLIITGKTAVNETVKELFGANSFMDFLIYAKQRNGGLGIYWRDLDKEDSEYDAGEDKACGLPESGAASTDREKLLAEVAGTSTETEYNVQDVEINDNDCGFLNALDRPYAHAKAAELNAKYSVTAVIRVGDEIQKEPYFAPSDIETGNDYHTVMQHIDLNAADKEQIKIEIERLTRENILKEYAAERLDINNLYRIMNSDIIRLAKNKTVYREQPFMLYTDFDGNKVLPDKVLIQGIIDMLIIDKNAIVVDFKASNGNPNYLKNKYSAQLQLYAGAVERVMKIPVERKVIFNVLTGELIDV